jgi:hypothetical protein
VTARVYPAHPDGGKVAAFNAGPGAAEVLSLDAWEMGSAQATGPILIL